MNERAIKAMGEPEVVVLMYDSYQQTIGVKASTLDKRNAFRPKKKDKRVGAGFYMPRISAASFASSQKERWRS